MYITSNKIIFCTTWALSLLVLSYSYLKLIDFKKTNKVELVVNKDKTFYNLHFNGSSYEQSNDTQICFAHVMTEFSKTEELVDLNFSGNALIELPVQDQDQDHYLQNFKFVGILSFNAFSQLGALHFNLQSNSLALQISGNNINPIKVTFQILSGAQTILSDRLEFPGPIILDPKGEQLVLIFPNLKRNILKKLLLFSNLNEFGNFSLSNSNQICTKSTLRISSKLIDQIKAYANNAL